MQTVAVLAWLQYVENTLLPERDFTIRGEIACGQSTVCVALIISMRFAVSASAVDLALVD